MIIDLLCLGPGGRFSKVSIINGPEKLQFQDRGLDSRKLVLQLI